MDDDIKSIRDEDGQIWTGRSDGVVTGPEGGVGDMIQLLATGGLSAFFYKEHATVEVDGEEHFGEIVETRDEAENDDEDEHDGDDHDDDDE